MRNFLENWNYKKHAVTITGLYLGASILGNAFFGKKIPEDEKSLNPVAVCKKLTKKQWIFNGILTGMYCIDMSATYCVLNYFKKQFK
ncbi:hypothetical protein [Sinanaerobacter chloroacetimidivorans]|jgi:hypothetical protein|uniref:Uncharacterized protein n=1 Tax=Sinanaerobacter chloroacetimidivorans TaxID=2818044 RepID=A0A8J7VWL0_9FIRM|nr:hypothetical protein [Sinanaerobacter chloroacetimidivorans]MBR0596372.1 hypothetical protein [Sinanaerobacter chloroacetimidivorans]